ncbi:MAG: hypothetical protein ACE5PT_11195 [Gemmatimonadales bacterium]
MHNVFILYIPPGNSEAMVHYQDTIVDRVPIERIGPHVSADLRSRLIGVFGKNRIAVWGSKSGSRNRSNFERMSPGDDILIVEGDSIKLIGKIAAKTENPALSRELWKTLSGDPVPWQLIYFIANPRPLDLPFTEFCQLFEYAPTYRLRGFTTVAAERLEAFYARYDDLYSILERMSRGEAFAQKGTVPEPAVSEQEGLVELHPEQVDDVLQEDLVSDHVKMQWKLACLGLKAGERVWVPVGDQAKLRKHYQFDAFDPEFVTGIDLPHSYVENIDVVWKREFRIAAAYEIENSTSIYSGLLRFADLNILAPNTLYPMFVVAPAARKNRLREQLTRPTFKRLGLDKTVWFLSYEKIEEIDTFFATAESGLSVETILGKAERVA